MGYVCFSRQDTQLNNEVLLWFVFRSGFFNHFLFCFFLAPLCLQPVSG